MINPIADPLVENVVAEDMTDLVRLEATPEGIAFVTITPSKRDYAFDGQTIAALHEVFETLHGADHVKVVFLRGQGDCFSAGLDGDWVRAGAEWTADDNRDDARAAAAMIKALLAVPALTFAMVRGKALAIGAALVAACDGAAATSDAVFAYPPPTTDPDAALAPSYIAEELGVRAAKLPYVEAATVGAAEALGTGLVQEVVTDAEALMALEERWAEAAMGATPERVAAVKAMRVVWG